jgi:hypothetical protein
MLPGRLLHLPWTVLRPLQLELRSRSPGIRWGKGWGANLGWVVVLFYLRSRGSYE